MRSAEVDGTGGDARPSRSVAMVRAGLAVWLLAGIGGCAAPQETPMRQSQAVMESAWGPFARQCAHTRTAHYVASGRSGAHEVTSDYESCVGFASMPANNGAVEITGSAGGGATSAPTLYRILRGPDGTSRTAAANDTGLLAQGSDDPAQAATFAGQLGLTHRQTIEPTDTLHLPIELFVPRPVQGTLDCHPDGGSVDHGRRTLVLACTLQEQAHTDWLNANLSLAGVEEIDVLTGVRLSGSFVGSLHGYQKGDTGTETSRVDNRIWYEKTTEFE